MEKQSVVKRTVSFLDQYFFSKTRFHSLGLIRIALVLLCIHQIYRNYRWMKGIAFINADLANMHEPSLLVKLLGVPFPLPPEYVSSFAYAYYFVAVCALIGLFTRPALVLFSLATIYIVDTEVARGFFNHEASLSTQVLLILAFAPGATSFSLDRLLSSLYTWYKTGKGHLLQALVGPPVAVWGTKLILILLACTYLTAGVSKIRFGGWAWLDGQTLSHYLDGSASPHTAGHKPMFIGPADVPQEEKWKDGFGIYTYSYGNRQKSAFWQEVGHSIASNRFVISGFAVGATVLELVSFLLLLSGWPRIFYLIGAILMHKSIGYLMDLPFINYQILCFLLIDWRLVYRSMPFGNGVKKKLTPLFYNFRLMLNRS